jgi:uncharacterized membrane protein
MKQCPFCELINSDNAEWCDCGYHFSVNTHIPSEHRSTLKEKHYSALTNISSIFMFFGFLTVVGTVISVGIGLKNEFFEQFRIYFILASIIGGVIGAVIFFSISKMAEIILDIIVGEIIGDISEKIEKIEKSVNKKEGTKDDNLRNA